MIPRAIEREHIFQAVAEIEREGVPAKRRSRKFFLKQTSTPTFSRSGARRCSFSDATT